MDYSDEISEFTRLSREYCDWCESRRSGGERQLHYEATRHLARLYAAAIELPDVELGEEDEAPDCHVPDDLSARVLKSFADLPFQYYREIFDPDADKDEDAVVGDLADDLTDIYIDLKRGLMILETGTETAAVFDWRCSFGFHWGRHATSALRALHCYDLPDQ